MSSDVSSHLSWRNHQSASMGYSYSFTCPHITLGRRTSASLLNGRGNSVLALCIEVKVTAVPKQARTAYNRVLPVLLVLKTAR